MLAPTVERLSPDQSSLALPMIQALLRELGEEGNELGAMDYAGLERIWRDNAERFHVFVARTAHGEPAGVLTLNETFAFYNNGYYGVIDEMYVAPGSRSQGIGTALLEAAKACGKTRGWARLDVTAPESERWARTRHFYEQEGFVFTGPKLKFLLR